jgi:chemotaxis protein MotB
MIDTKNADDKRVPPAVALVPAIIFAILAALGWYLHFDGRNQSERLARDLEARIASLETAAGRLEEEKNSLQKDLDRERDGRMALQADLDRERGNQQETRQALEAERAAIAELRRTLAAEQETANELQSALEVSRGQQQKLARELESELARLADSNATLENELQRGRAQQRSLDAQIAEVSGDVEAKEAALDHARRDIERLAVELDQTRLEQGELKAKYAELDKQHEQEARHFAALQQRLQQELKESRVEIRQLRNRMTVIDLTSEVLFGSGSARLKPAGQKVLDLIADSLNAYPERAISIEGHTDNVPIGRNSPYLSNWDLSAARAMAAVDYLQRKAAVAPQRLRVVGHGEYHPVASNDSAEGRQRNRRIEIRLLPDSEHTS